MHKGVTMKGLAFILMAISLIVGLVGCNGSGKVTTQLAIEELPVSDITEISAVVSWLTSEPASSKVIYGLTTTNETFNVTDSRLSSTHSIELKWLQPNTSYCYKVYSQGVHGNEALSDENVFHTKALPPDRGIIIGTVLYGDGTPANHVFMYIFRDEESSCFAFCITDTDGCYIFDNLPFGRYEIYSSGMELGRECDGWYCVEKEVYRPFARPPEIVNLTKSELRIAPTRTHFRAIKIHHLEEYINTNQPEISWQPVPTAAYYKVEIWSSTGHYGEYEREITVFNTSIIWPEPLAKMRYGISVYAYDSHNTYLTDDYDSFWIGPRQGNNRK